MGVDIEQTRDDELRSRIDGVGCVTRNVGFDGDDAASRDGHVADRIEPYGGVNDASALDDQVIACREDSRNAGEDRGTCRGG